MDAVGRAITEAGNRLEAMEEAQRPGLVVFVITTDGMENSSREFTKGQIKEMIQHQQERYDWHFTFLAANQDAFAEAGGLGIHPDRAALFVADKISSAYMVTASKTSRMREQRRTGMPVEDRFTDEERDRMT